MKLSILIPTNAQADRLEMMQLYLLPSLAKQDLEDFTALQVIIISHPDVDLGNFKLFLEGFAQEMIRGNQGKSINIEIYKASGRIANKVREVLPHILHPLVMVVDDDIEFQTTTLLKNCARRLESNGDTAAVAAYIFEEKGPYNLRNFITTSFYKMFRLWDVDDQKMKVYNPYGKGWASFRELVNSSIINGCHWLPSNSLFIRKSTLELRINQMFKDMELLQSLDPEAWPTSSLWAVDFYVTYPLYLEGYNLAVMVDEVSHHRGYEATTYGYSRRIKQETLWGYYYYKMFFDKGGVSYLTRFLYPNVGRLLHYTFVTLVREKNLIAFVECMRALGSSFMLLSRKKHEVDNLFTHKSLSAPKYIYKLTN